MSTRIARLIAAAIVAASLGANVAHADDTDKLASEIAGALAAGNCPASSAVSAAHQLQARTGTSAVEDRRIKHFYDTLHSQTTLGGAPFSVVWTEATATAAATPATTALRHFSACFGSAVADDGTFQKMLGAMNPGINRAAKTAVAAGRVVLSSEIGMVVTMTEGVLRTFAFDFVADLRVDDSLAGSYEATFPATGKYDGEDAAQQSGLGLDSGAANDPVGALSNGGTHALGEVNSLLAPQKRSGYSRAYEKLTAKDITGLNDLFWMSNSIAWQWNYDKRQVGPSTSATEDENTYYDFHPLTWWQFDGWKRNQADYDQFPIGNEHGEWKHRLTGRWSSHMLAFIGDIEIESTTAYVNLYGHFDGMWSNYQGGDWGNDYVYCYGNPEEC